MNLTLQKRTFKQDAKEGSLEPKRKIMRIKKNTVIENLDKVEEDQIKNTLYYRTVAMQTETRYPCNYDDNLTIDKTFSKLHSVHQTSIDSQTDDHDTELNTIHESTDHVMKRSKHRFIETTKKSQVHDSDDLYKTVREISTNVVGIRKQLTQISDKCNKGHDTATKQTVCDPKQFGIFGIEKEVCTQNSDENDLLVFSPIDHEQLIETLTSHNTSTINKIEEQSNQKNTDLKPKLESEKNDTDESKEDMNNIAPKILRSTPEFVFSATGVTTELHTKIKERNTERVLNILQEEHNGINFRDESGTTPLHVALTIGDASMISTLIFHGADPNITDSSLRNGLHYAVETSSSLIVDMVMKSITDISSKDKDGKTVLHCLALRNDLEIAKKLLAEDKLKGNSNFVNITNSVGQASLHIAAYLGNAEFIKILIQFKCDLDIQDNEGLTSLHNTILTLTPGDK